MDERVAKGIEFGPRTTPAEQREYLLAIENALPMGLPHAVEVIEFFVPGQPVAKGRARSRIVRAGDGREFVSHYTPSQTRSYENLVALAAKDAMQARAPWSAPVLLEVFIAMEVPASWSQKKRRGCIAGLIAPTKKPDYSNIVKSVEDGCNAIVYADDCFIVDALVRKRYAATPGVTVRVKKLSMACA
jgi:Holliday junction resolvase RusA-like endonuclease